MTLQTVLAWSIGRSLIITAIALPLSLCVWRLVQSDGRTSNRRRLLFFAALLPLFVPDLLIGFAYRLTAARLIHSEMATECLYGALLLFRIIALQVAVYLILPAAPISPESLHSWKLLPHRNFAWVQSWLRMLLLGPWRTTFVAFVAGALLSFQEFETAALLQVDRHPITFTVWLFDAHAAGETLSRSLQFVTGPVIFQLALLVPVVALLTVSDQHAGRRTIPPNATSFIHFGAKSLGALVIIAGMFLILAWPTISNGAGVLSGIADLATQGSLVGRAQQILVSLTAAAISASLALLFAVSIRRKESRWMAVTALLPGLCGSLVLSILLLAMFQLPVLNIVYDSWIPMIVGGTLLLLPRAFVLVFVLEVAAAASSRHSAQILKAGDAEQAKTWHQLLWQLVQFRWLLALAVLTHWSFWDVTVASILRPIRFEPVVTRLYNEMHYGRTESLVAITFLALLVPVIVFCGVACLLKLRPGRRKFAS